MWTGGCATMTVSAVRDRQAPLLLPALSTPLSFLPAPPLAHTWRLDTNVTTSRSGLESATLSWGQSWDLSCSSPRAHGTQNCCGQRLWTEAEDGGCGQRRRTEAGAGLSCGFVCGSGGGLCRQAAPSRVAGANQGAPGAESMPRRQEANWLSGSLTC